MLRVALTGGIATGKSYVRAALAARGIPTIDSDRIVHELLGPGTPVSGQVADRFGPSVLREDGSVDRKRLGAVVFSEATARAALEQIVHPPVYDRIARWFDTLPPSPRSWAVADIPLLYETGHQSDFDRVVVVACEPARQVERLVARDGIEEEAARARLAAQWPIGRKLALANFTIRTDGSFEDTDRQVEEVIRALDQTARGDSSIDDR